MTVTRDRIHEELGERELQLNSSVEEDWEDWPTMEYTISIYDMADLQFFRITSEDSMDELEEKIDECIENLEYLDYD